MFGKKKELPKVMVKEIEKPEELAPQEPEKPEVFRVIKELPTTQIRKFKDTETGEIVNLMTIEEALTEIIEKIRQE